MLFKIAYINRDFKVGLLSLIYEIKLCSQSKQNAMKINANSIKTTLKGHLIHDLVKS